MRAVIQRATEASVTVDGRVVGAIGRGLVAFAAVGDEDTEADLDWMVEKIRHLRIFAGDDGRFDRSVEEIGGEVLAVSQFTLYGDCRKGRRPSFTHAAAPERARAMFENFVAKLQAAGLATATGEFQAMMRVDVAGDGPVTILLDSSKLF